MTKVKLTKIGEVWCSAGKPFCRECHLPCGSAYFEEEPDFNVTKEVEIEE